MVARQNPVYALVTGCIFFCIAIPASAGIWYVAADADPGGDGTSWETAYDTIQAGIVAASAGDEVLIADGTYTGEGNQEISFLGKAITVRSENGPGNCVIECSIPFPTSGYYGFEFTNGETPESILDGITIRNGTGHYYLYQQTQNVTCGGGIFCDSSSPVIQNCVFTENTLYLSGFGGGCFVSNGSPTIRRCTFVTNTSKYAGGAIGAIASSASIEDCRFHVNMAKGSLGSRGGAIYAEESPLSIVNCSFVANVAFSPYSASGGAIYVNDESPVSIINCTMTENYYLGYGGEPAVHAPSSTTLTNCIIWNNYGYSPVLSPSFAEQALIACTATYCCIEGGASGTGNIDDDPLFVRPPSDGGDGWEDVSSTPEDESANNDYGNLHLLLGSPCLDAGSNSVLAPGITTDLEGNPRYVDNIAEDSGSGTAPIIDMGALESQAIVLHVNAEGTADYPTIQAAIDASTNGDTVLCHDGTYTGDGNRDISFNGKAIIVMSLNGPGNCIIDCEATSDSPHRGFRFTEQETMESVLDGFTITNGLAPEEDPEGSGINMGHGGAMYLFESSPIIRNCHIISNRSDFGGAVSCFDSSPVFEQCILEYNDSERAGGIYINSSSLILSKCEFYCNRAFRNSPAGGMTYGGAICSESDTSLTMTDCIIIGNNAYGMNSSGSSIYSDMTSTVRMVNSCLAANEGGLHCSGELIAINCTFYGNTSTYPDRNREIICSGGSIDLVNCIAWGPPEISESPIWLTLGAVAQITYSNIQNGWEGDRNINQPPLITRNPDDGGDGWHQSSGPDLNNDYGDLRLLPGSPGIDVGNNGAVPAEITLDLAGITRFIDDPDSEDPIYSTAPVVDMGAYEYDPTNGDWDRDGDVDLQDFAAFQVCINSADAQCLVVFDLDTDLDIDLDDFLLFECLITGPR